MFIQTFETPNENALKFVPEGTQILEPGNSVEYNNALSAYTSPLARKLFQIDGVQSVYLASEFVSVTKQPESSWHLLKPQVFSSLMNFFASGEPVLTQDAAVPDTAIQPEDDEVVIQIKELIETRVRPSVQVDGGDIEYKGFVDGVVLVKLKGACRGCSSSSITLKGGIERMMMHYIPEVSAVMAVEEDEVLNVQPTHASNRSSSLRRIERVACLCALILTNNIKSESDDL
jgi:NFU1 iron-sulfur cluster scaffold homolog, mitochondrial